MRPAASACAAALLVAAVARGQEPPGEPAPLPNVVVILADDLGSGDLACANQDSAIPTPHFDRLAREGMRLTDAHSPSAVCTPTRYGLLTGRYSWRTRLKSGVLVGDSANLIDPQRLTLPDLLRERGYRTACVGKWHLGLGEGPKTDYSQPLRPGPLDHGFDAFFGIPASLDMAPYVYVLGDRPVQPASERVERSAHRRDGGGGFWRGGAVAPDFRHVEVLPRLTQRAVEIVERFHREGEGRPFFLYLPLSAPHTPWLPTEAFVGASRAGHYGDFVAQVDDAVGEVLAALDRLGIADRTLVIATSDNGSHWPVSDVERWGHAANLSWRGQKADIWEGGHRVPFVARWPGRIPAGKVRDGLFCLTDLMATLAAVTGAILPEDAGEDSYDQWPLLSGEALDEPIRSDAVHHSHGGLFAIRRGPWKLIEGLGSGGFTAPRTAEPEEGGAVGQLYHLGWDPGEAENLYLAEPEVVAELSALLARQRESGRSRPLD